MLGGPGWALCAAILLAAGFLTTVHAGAAIALARLEPGAAVSVETAFAVYARVVLVKGLLPALLLALAIWPLLDRGGRFSGRGRWRLALGLAIAATHASMATAAARLPLALPGLPPVRFTGSMNFARTCAEMAGAVMLAAWIPRSVAKRTAAAIAVGVVALFVAAWAVKRHGVAPQDPVLAVAPEAGAPPVSLPVPPPAAPAPDGATAALPEVRPLARDPESEPLGWEEIERRRAIAARIRKWIEAGPDATGPPSGSGLFAEGAPLPIYENGELLGVELRDLRPDGFYARLGLRDGDLVQSINGIALADSDALLQEIAGSQTFEVSVERSDGTRDQISLQRAQVLEGLKSLE
jgi:hypothetical protein